MPEYFLTFGSQYTPRNQRHPTFDKAHADGWVVIDADSYEQARAEVVRRLDTRWSMLYGADGFEPEFFPLGELARWNARIPLDALPFYPCWQVRDAHAAAADAGALEPYTDRAHALHPEHLHSENDVLMTCLGYVRPGGLGYVRPRDGVRG